MLEVAPAAGIECVEEDMTIDAFRRVDEAFLTSTTRDVQPVDAVDGRALARVCGPLTRRLADAFASLVARDPDP